MLKAHRKHVERALRDIAKAKEMLEAAAIVVARINELEQERFERGDMTLAETRMTQDEEGGQLLYVIRKLQDVNDALDSAFTTKESMGKVVQQLDALPIPEDFDPS